MRNYVGVLMILCCLLATEAKADAPTAGVQAEEQSPTPLRVLVLYSNQRTLPANQEIQQGLWSSLEGVISSRQIELFEEYLETHRLPDGDEEPTMVSYLRKRYQAVKPDIVASIGPQALEFSNQWSSEVFPEAVRVFAGVRADELARSPKNQDISGNLNGVAVRPLLEVVSLLLPDTQEVVLVGGTAKFDRNLLIEARRQVESAFHWKVREISGSTPEVIASELPQLNPGTVVLFTTYFRDSAGVTYIPKKVLEILCHESAVPVFGLYDTMLGSGVTGIGASPFIEQGRGLGKILERMNEGESAEEIGVVGVPPPKFLFDARSMRRYGLNPDSAPPEVEIFFDSPSLIEAHPIAFAVGVVTIIVQALLILALLLTRYRKIQAEKRAVQMGQYFSTIFRENPNAMAIVRISDGVFEDINPAWESLYGISREEAHGRSPVAIGILSEKEDGDLYDDFLNANKSLAGYERQLRTGNGEIRNVALYSNAIEVNGNQLHIITALDTSDRIEAERLRNNLARDNRLTQLGQISAWIAHEINQPLGSILNDAEAGLLYLDQDAGQHAELREILEDIKTEDRRASRVVQQIRTMLGSHAVGKERVCLSEVMEEAIHMASPEAGRRGVELHTSSSEGATGLVLGERVLLVQVLFNLVFNAMDAVAKEPISRRIITLGCEVSPEDKHASITVCDRGPGIGQNESESIFELFYSTKEDGLGLGLAISKLIIEDHGGELTVENIRDEGACFRIKLPLQNN